MAKMNICFLRILFITGLRSIFMVYATESSDQNTRSGFTKHENNPRLDTLDDQQIISTGKSWKIQCTGTAPLTWTYPGCKQNVKAPGRIHITPLEDTDIYFPGDQREQTEFTSTLEITKLEYYDTGYYICQYQDNYPDCDDRLYDKEDVAAIYLYARDLIHLISLEYPVYTYNVHEDTEIVIPCKPTDPSIQMKFKHGNKDITDVLSSYNFRYDDKRGLVSISGQSNQRGRLTCKADRNGISEEKNIMIKFYLPFSHYYYSTAVSGPCLKDLVSQETINIKCSFEIDSSAPPIKLIWEIDHENNSHLKEGISSKHFEIEKAQVTVRYDKLSGQKKRNYTETLTINSLRKEDEGDYKCIALVPDSGEKSTIMEKDSYILEDVRNDKNELFIAESEDHSIISLPDRDRCVEKCTNECKRRHKCDLRWVLYKDNNNSIFATPNPKYRWYKPNGKLIDVAIGERHGNYEMSIEGDCKEDMKLVKKRPKLEDMGEYTLKISVLNPITSEEQTKNISLVMVYNKEPIPSLHLSETGVKRRHKKKKKRKKLKPRLQQADISTFRRAYIEHDLTCRIKGYPIDLDAIRMTFIPCIDSMSDACQETLIPLTQWVPVDGLLNERYSHIYESTFRTVLNESGILTCSVCHSVEDNSCEKQTSTSETIYLSEYDEGFQLIKPKNDTVIELQHIFLMCAASKYLYKDVAWYKENTMTGAWENVKNVYRNNRQGVQIDNKSHKEFSYIANITFSKVSLEENGKYECRATPLITGENPTIEQLDLSVLKSIKPYKKESFNMNDTSKCSENACTEGLDTLLLDCSIDGRPKPVIEWKFKSKDEDMFQDFPPDTEYFDGTFEYNDPLTKEQIRFKSLWKEHSGIYKCIAKSVAGEMVGTRQVSIVKHTPITKGVIAGVVIGILFLIGLIIFLVYKLCWYNKQLRKLTDIEMKMFEEGDVSKINPTLGVDDQADLLPYNKEFEFDRKKLNLGDQIGSGAFGRVVKAEALGIINKHETTPVAVKMVKRDADITYIKALMAELKIMIHLGKVSIFRRRYHLSF